MGKVGEHLSPILVDFLGRRCRAILREKAITGFFGLELLNSAALQPLLANDERIRPARCLHLRFGFQRLSEVVRQFNGQVHGFRAAKALANVFALL